MNVPDSDLVLAYLEGVLPPGEAAAFERRLADSPALRELLAEQRRTRDLLRSAPSPRLTSAERERLLSTLRRELHVDLPAGRSERSVPSRPRLRYRLAAALAAGGVLLLAVVFVVRGGTRLPVGSSEAALETTLTAAQATPRERAAGEAEDAAVPSTAAPATTELSTATARGATVGATAYEAPAPSAAEVLAALEGRGPEPGGEPTRLPPDETAPCSSAVSAALADRHVPADLLVPVGVASGSEGVSWFVVAEDPNGAPLAVVVVSRDGCTVRDVAVTGTTPPGD